MPLKPDRLERLGKYHLDWKEISKVSLAISIILVAPFVFGSPIIIPIALFLLVTGTYFVLSDFSIPIHHFLFLLIGLAILTPPIEFSSSLPAVRFEEIIIYMFFPLILILNYGQLSLSKPARAFIKIYCAFILFAVISTFYGYFALNVPPSVRDLFEIITYLKYLLIFLTLHTFRIEPKRITPILYFILITIMISGAFGILQYFGVFNLDSITGPYYLQDRIHLINNRLTATYKNPNTYSAILVTGHLIALGLFFYEDRRKQKTLLLFSIALLAVFILFAASRTMIAAYLLVTVIMILIGASKAGYSKLQIISLITVLGISFLIAVSFISYRIIVRLESGLDIFSDESFAMRILAWYLNLQLFFQSPILGWGAAKAIHTTVVDNEFILILRRYGIIGLTIFAGIYLQPMFTAFKNLKSDSKLIFLFTSIILTTIITFILAGLTNTLFHNMQVMDFWFVLLSLYFIVTGSTKYSETDDT